MLIVICNCINPIVVLPLLLAAIAPISLIEDGKAVDVHLNSSHWTQADGYVEGNGVGNVLVAGRTIEGGAFHVKARLRMLNQEASAASFFLGPNHFGFEGAKRTFYLSGPMFGGLKLLGSPTEVFERGDWIDFEAVRKTDEIRFIVNDKEIHAQQYDGDGFDRFGFSPHRSTMQVTEFTVLGNTTELVAPQLASYTIPTIDLADHKHRQVVVDREKGQYLGHPTTVLLEDHKTILCVYPKGHGRGAIVYKRSNDGGLTWSDRLPTPASWATSKEVPTIHRVVDADGKKRLIIWSGLYPARLAVSEDDGASWSELQPVGDWGGIVVMGFVEKLSTPGRYIAMFHDDGRFFTKSGRLKTPVEFRLYKTFSEDGGLTWSSPKVVQKDAAVHLCEPGVMRSPDGKQMAVLLRENSRRRNSHVIFSDDEGQSWTKPRELPAALTGDRHTGVFAPDGRLFISFRDTTRESPTKGDWVAWVGTYDDIVKGREGQYRVRLMDNHKGGDCAYPGVLILPDGTIVTTTYGHWEPEEAPFVVCIRLKLEELDKLQE
jgi:hypothetical protein